MKKKLKIAFDCDDVVASCNQEALNRLNAEKKTEFTLEDISGWNSDDETKERIKFFSSPEFVKEQPVTPGARELILALIERGCEIFFITAVPLCCLCARAEWLRRYFPEVPEENLIFARRKDVCSVDVLIDDSPKNIQNSVATYPILVQQPWNKAVTGWRSVRADHLYEDTLNLIDVLLRYGGYSDSSKAKILCLVGPSGSGKSEIADELGKYGYIRPTNYTTAVRPEPYKHVPVNEFVQLKQAGKFIETTSYGGEYYGTLTEDIDGIVENGQKMVMPMDICGANALKRRYGDAVKIVYVHKEKDALIKAILEKPISQDMRVARILALDGEEKNADFCDDFIDNIDASSTAGLLAER